MIGYNPPMGLNHVDIESAMRRLADKRIEDAIAEGKFDNLPGRGKPLDLEPMPAEENARMTWWALRLMKQNNFIPDEVQWRKQIDGLRERIDQLNDESKLEPLVRQVNQLVRKLNTLGTNAIAHGLVPMDLQRERERLRSRVRRT